MAIISTLNQGFVAPSWLAAQFAPPDPPAGDQHRGDWPHRWQCEICGEWKDPEQCAMTTAGEIVCEDCDQLSADEQMERFFRWMEGPYALLDPLGIEVVS